MLGDRLAAELSTRLLGEAMAAVRAAGLAETETAIRAERIIETVKAAIEKGDFKRLETGLGDILEVFSLFSLMDASIKEYTTFCGQCDLFFFPTL